jgi:hypothetical protein
MRYAALLLALMPSCAMMQAAAKPASVAASAALGGLVGGPAGAGGAAGATAAAWNIADAEEDEADAKNRLDAITIAAIREEVRKEGTTLEGQLTGQGSALQAKLLEEIGRRTSTQRGWLTQELDGVKAWTWWVLKWAAILYIIKQVLFSKRTPAILGWILQRFRDPTGDAT